MTMLLFGFVAVTGSYSVTVGDAWYFGRASFVALLWSRFGFGVLASWVVALRSSWLEVGGAFESR